LLPQGSWQATHWILRHRRTELRICRGLWGGGPTGLDHSKWSAFPRRRVRSGCLQNRKCEDANYWVDITVEMNGQKLMRKFILKDLCRVLITNHSWWNKYKSVDYLLIHFVEDSRDSGARSWKNSWRAGFEVSFAAMNRLWFREQLVLRWKPNLCFPPMLFPWVSFVWTWSELLRVCDYWHKQWWPKIMNYAKSMILIAPNPTMISFHIHTFVSSQSRSLELYIFLCLVSRCASVTFVVWHLFVYSFFCQFDWWHNFAFKYLLFQFNFVWVWSSLLNFVGIPQTRPRVSKASNLTW
jgi:hypothetical protein